MTRNQPVFSAKALLAELASQGLRIAQAHEPGWRYTAWCGTKVWVTNL